MCRRWRGYTLTSALAEDAHLLGQTLALIDLKDAVLNSDDDEDEDDDGE